MSIAKACSAGGVLLAISTTPHVSTHRHHVSFRKIKYEIKYYFLCLLGSDALNGSHTPPFQNSSMSDESTRSSTITYKLRVSSLHGDLGMYIYKHTHKNMNNVRDILIMLITHA